MGLTQSYPSPEGMEAMEKGMAQFWGADKGSFVLPYFLGGMFNFVMFGLAIEQYIYWLLWTKVSKERRFVMIMVSIAMCAAIASVIYILPVSGYPTSSFGILASTRPSQSPNVSETYLLSVRAEYSHRVLRPSGYAMIDNVMTFSVQAFYADRSFRLNKRQNWVLLLIISTMFVSTGGAVAMYIQWYMKPWGSKSLFEDPHVLTVFYLWGFGVLSTDLGITITMAYGLKKSKTGWERTDRTISRLVWLSLETQLPALCSAICLVVLYTMKQETTLGIFFLMSHTHIYIIGLLAMLNYRRTLQAELGGAETYIHTTSHTGSQPVIMAGEAAALELGESRSRVDHEKGF